MTSFLTRSLVKLIVKNRSDSNGF